MSAVQLTTIIGLTFDLIGVVLIAYAALSVHHRFRHEHRVDDEVFSAMLTEQRLGLTGVSLIIVGYLLQVIAQFIA